MCGMWHSVCVCVCTNSLTDVYCWKFRPDRMRGVGDWCWACRRVGILPWGVVMDCGLCTMLGSGTGSSCWCRVMCCGVFRGG